MNYAYGFFFMLGAACYALLTAGVFFIYRATAENRKQRGTKEAMEFLKAAQNAGALSIHTVCENKTNGEVQ